MDIWHVNIAGSTDLPDGWTWGEHWDNSGSAGYFLNGPDGFRAKAREAGAWMPTVNKLIADRAEEQERLARSRLAKRLTYADNTGTGHGWEVVGSTRECHPGWMGALPLHWHLANIELAKAAGWGVDIIGDGPGSSELRAAAA
jgi:hypothetical protein